MKTSPSILRQNTLESGMMKVLVFATSAFLFFGCNSYQVEMDPDWKGGPSDQSDTTEPSTEDPTDDEPPWIELSEPDNTDPSDSDSCAFVDCSDFGPFCYDDIGVECCDPCLAGVEQCHPDSPGAFYNEVLLCAGGCWETSSYCGDLSYCQNTLDGESDCTPLPTEYDGECEPGLEWVDPDCQSCTTCSVLGESYCDHSGLSDTLIECRDATGYGHYCWDLQTCATTAFDSICVADLASNFAACTDQSPIEEFCGQFMCTGTTTCDGEDGSAGIPIEDCGYCDTCCDPAQGALCGFDAAYQSGGAAILYPRDDLLCYEAMSCNDTAAGEQFYCKMSYESGPICEMASF